LLRRGLRDLYFGLQKCEISHPRPPPTSPPLWRRSTGLNSVANTSPVSLTGVCAARACLLPAQMFTAPECAPKRAFTPRKNSPAFWSTSTLAPALRNTPRRSLDLLQAYLDSPDAVNTWVLSRMARIRPLRPPRWERHLTRTLRRLHDGRKDRTCETYAWILARALMQGPQRARILRILHRQRRDSLVGPKLLETRKVEHRLILRAEPPAPLNLACFGIGGRLNSRSTPHQR
jgi:hypothetical protein